MIRYRLANFIHAIDMTNMMEDLQWQKEVDSRAAVCREI